MNASLIAKINQIDFGPITIVCFSCILLNIKSKQSLQKSWFSKHVMAMYPCKNEADWLDCKEKNEP